MAENSQKCHCAIFAYLNFRGYLSQSNKKNNIRDYSTEETLLGIKKLSKILSMKFTFKNLIIIELD